MRLLLDTHTFLWFITGDPQLSARARTLIEVEGNEKLVSPVSHWEIAIKVSIGRLILSEPFEILIPRELVQNDFHILPIEVSHTTEVSKLSFHHRDPFDRLLIGQAIAEQIPVVSVDSAFDAYPVTWLW